MTTAAKPDTKSLLMPFSVKAVDAEARTFEGLASTWDLDLGGDVIHRGAFKKTIGDWRATGRVLPLIDQHNYGSVRSVVGKMMEAKETKDGLVAKFEVIKGADGDEVLARLEGGYVDGLSIGYRAIKVDYATEAEQLEGIFRHLKEVELREVSVVIWPMNIGARIDTDSIKALIGRYEGRDLDEDEKAEVTSLREKLDALLESEEQHEGEDAAGKDAGLAPDHPQRIAAEATLRALKVRQVRGSSYSRTGAGTERRGTNATQTGEDR